MFVAPEARAHVRDENYVWLNVRTDALEGLFEIRLADPRAHLGVAIADDADTARRQLPASADRVQAYLLDHFRVEAGGDALEPVFGEPEIFDSESHLGCFAHYPFRIEGADIPNELLITSTIFFDADPNQRSLLCMQFNERTGQEFGQEFTALVFGPTRPQQTLDLTDVQGLPPARAFVAKGARAMVGHVPHLGFILLLLLSSVVTPTKDGWRPVPTLTGALGRLVAAFVVFSLAHGLTLGLAGLDLMHAPAALVWSTVLLSVVLLGLNNIIGMLGAGVPLVVFFLGLFHGLGLASNLSHLPFRMIDLEWVLLGFTVGVEIGQALVVLAAFPVLFLLRRTRMFLPVVLVGGSILIILATTGSLAEWAIER